LALLRQVGIYPHDVSPPDIDESPLPRETPRDYVRRIARAKLAATTAGERDVVLCADTTVAVGRRILGKPEGEAEAREMLQLLSGRRHCVITAVRVRRQDRTWEKIVTTAVQMKRLSSAEIESYLVTAEWEGKAGAYAIQGLAGAFIPWINGSFTGVVGLPLAETLGLLTAAGYDVRGML
jgi:septum formation protein